jgi:hypothetical protein
VAVGSHEVDYLDAFKSRLGKEVASSPALTILGAERAVSSDRDNRDIIVSATNGTVSERAGVCRDLPLPFVER